MTIKRLMSWGVVAFWMALIFSFSAQQGSDSGSLSGSLVDFLIALFPRLDLDRDIVHLILRKGAHFTVYLILGFLSANALTMSGVIGKKRFVYALLISVLYAASDEFHQGFVPGRGPSLVDVGIDGIGSAFGIAFYHGLFRRKGY